MKYITFSSLKEMEEYFSKNINPKFFSKFECSILKDYKKRRILFTAPHAKVGRVWLDRNKKLFAGVGEKNTDKLCKLAALYTSTSYIIPYVLRTEIDLNRSPEEVGKGITLLAPLYKDGKFIGTTRIPIHTNKKMTHLLREYNGFIEKINPKAIVFFHGMRSDRKFDVLLGFGKDYNGIGGKKNGFKFKRELIEKTKEIFKEFGIREEWKIGVSISLFVGESSYPLRKHIIEYNQKNKGKRIGMLVEINGKRIIWKRNRELPTKSCQLFVQSLSELVLEWIKDLS